MPAAATADTPPDRSGLSYEENVTINMVCVAASKQGNGAYNNCVRGQLAALAKHPAASEAIDQHDLRDRVVAWKGQFFGSSWANYDQAKPGTFHFVPPAARLPALWRDYQAMRDMYLSEPPSFDEVLALLADLERRINRGGDG